MNPSKISYNPERGTVKGRTLTQIHRAKQKAVGGAKKRCKKGKSCSATCIANNKVCLVDIPLSTSLEIPKVVSQIRGATDSVLGKTLSKLPGQLTVTRDLNEAMVKMIDRPSLVAEKKNLMEAKRAVRKLEREGKLSSETKAELKDRFRAIAKVLKAEGEPSAVKARNDEDAKNPQYLSQLKAIRSAERLAKAQREIIGLIDARLDKIQFGSAEFKRWMSRREANAKLLRIYEDDGRNKRVQLRELQKVNQPSPPKKGITANLSYTSQTARERLKDVFDKLEGLKLLLKTKGEEFVGNINWEAAIGTGARRLGKPGAYGAFVKIPPEELFKFGVKGNHPDGVGVKGGKIGINEPAILKRVGEAGLGPRLIAAKTDANFADASANTRRGLIAMGIVPGRDMFDRRHTDDVNGVNAGRAFWEARRDLHRLGIAHNDMHPGNILIDDKGKARFVDFGLAQAFPKAALAEAVGAVTKSDWQVNRWAELGGDAAGSKASAYTRMKGNWERLKDAMRKDGLTDADISHIGSTGIRRDEKGDYTSKTWQNPALTDRRIREYMDILYDGI